ncbi:MAG: hypothetical protein IJL75_01295 [Eubacterium sp.]|nr:hypothetical protein [Eubacterium sp.]
MKNIKKTLSMVLVFALIFTSFAFVPKTAGAEEEEKYGVDYVRNNFQVVAPYEQYFKEEDTIDLEKEDLNDDFGIGLEVGENAKFTALRGIAKAIRNYILYEVMNLDRYEEGIPTEEQKQKANAMMPNYLKVEDSGWGLAITGISTNGKDFNTGVFKDGGAADGSMTSGADGCWYFLVGKDIYGEYDDPQKGVNEFVFGDNSEITETYCENIKLVWLSNSYRIGEISYPQNKYGVAFETEPTDYILSSYSVFDTEKTKEPVADAKIELVDDDNKVVCTTTTDANGKFTIPAQKSAGITYSIKAYLEKTTADGKTYSDLSYTAQSFYPRLLPKKAKSVKAKVKGKKSAKKKNIKVIWKNGHDYADARTVYTVYISQKKSKGYKKAGKGDGNNTSCTVKKMKKGTYYIKLKTTEYYTPDYTSEGGDAVDSVTRSSGYTTPIKVKVK